jgi:hypothetical protein
LFLWWSLGFPLFLGLLLWSPPWSLGFALFLELLLWSLLWSLGFALFLELLLWSLLWSLGLPLFLELLLTPSMLQGSHFLFLVHLSRAKSKLRYYSSIFMLFKEGGLINQATTKCSGDKSEGGKPKHQIPNPKQKKGRT